MPYPPGPLDAVKTNATPTKDDHAPHHNALATAINDVVTILGAAPEGGEADVTARLAAVDVLTAALGGLVAAHHARHEDGGADEVGLDASQVVSGVFDAARMPPIAISTFLGVVADEAAMLALVGEVGDWAIRSDLMATFIIVGDNPSVLADWEPLPTPTDAVLSVNGRVGAVTGLAEVSALADKVAKAGDTMTGGLAAPTLEASGKNALSPRRNVGRKTTAAAPTTGTWAVDDEVLDSGGVLWRCTVAGTPGTWMPVSGTIATATQPGDNYTLALADGGTVVEANKATALTITAPPNSAVAFPVGTLIEVFQLGAGQVTVAAGVGVTLRAPFGTKTSAQYTSAFLRKRGTDEWVVSGDTTT